MVAMNLLSSLRSTKTNQALALMPLFFFQVASLIADPDIDENLVTFPGNDWWQVENAWPASGIVCDAAGSNRRCLLEAGRYKWVEFLDSGIVSGLLTIESAANEDSLQFIVAEQRCSKDLWLGLDECDGDHCIVETRYDRQELFGDTGEYISAPSEYFGCRVDCPDDFKVVSAEAEGGIGFDAIFAYKSEIEFFQTRGIGTSSVEILQFDFPNHEIESFATQTWIEARAVCANF